MKKLFVGNLPWSVDTAAIQKLFEPYNPSSAQVLTDRETGRSRGFGFVEGDDEAMEKAIQELNGKDIDGRAIVVNEARPREDR